MNPGSDEALDNGCLCPVLDNGHGKKRDGLFWRNADCPLHGVKIGKPDDQSTQTAQNTLQQPNATRT